jgi:hypothetical protein
MVVAVFLALGVVYVETGDWAGKVDQSGDVMTKTLGAAEPKATSSFDIVLLEGGDAVHEATHIFGSLTSPAIASASLNLKTLRLDIVYDNALIKEAGVRQLLLAAGYLKATPADAVAATLSVDGTSQELTVNVGEALDPTVMSAKAGVPLKIAFSQGAQHLASISIVELGVQEDLSNGGATVEVADPKPGTYNIMCAEGVADGTLIVE